ncbi:hypothetical protein [Actimicrobium sp. CCI2.3]|uniref:hypothetical protein n=1 Tax=Actimicrobium sp. CCI2.3 TaxID=3048616 RepID=UPI002AB5C6E3|nr:hypothetical protein [Actimicrobium sp. CCI2.3]MDY7575212.1 hypothetical protein [Actimicrobium sp. CCI2.3]MEB0022325.1 hypothetical protein [Actimicrobium sp. CCI2.3]
MILETGNVIDPYFALQALLLAQENGLDISAYATSWITWLTARQRLDGSFDRFCRTGPVWLGCREADADDALLAIWLKFLDTVPAQPDSEPTWRKSRHAARTTLESLLDKKRGTYLVSPTFQHGLFMDNLEVWSYHSAQVGQAANQRTRQFAQAIHNTFWDAQSGRFLVSTQPEQKTVAAAFYPDHVAQIFPLLVDYPLLPTDAGSYYRSWMKQHRALWLKQVSHDYAWGLIAYVAMKQNDKTSAQCWLREALPYQRTGHWTVTDEVVAQILQSKGLKPAVANSACN